MIYNNPAYVGNRTYTPVLTLVGGAGNTVPDYTTTAGYYSIVGDRCYVEVYFNGDGGNEGAGTGQFNLSLPVTSNAINQTYNVVCGNALNNTAILQLFGQIAGATTTIAISRISAGSFISWVGNDQNNATRTVRFSFSYII